MRFLTFLSKKCMGILINLSLLAFTIYFAQAAHEYAELRKHNMKNMESSAATDNHPELRQFRGPTLVNLTEAKPGINQ